MGTKIIHATEQQSPCAAHYWAHTLWSPSDMTREPKCHSYKVCVPHKGSCRTQWRLRVPQHTHKIKKIKEVQRKDDQDADSSQWTKIQTIPREIKIWCRTIVQNLFCTILRYVEALMWQESEMGTDTSAKQLGSHFANLHPCWYKLLYGRLNGVLWEKRNGDCTSYF